MSLINSCLPSRQPSGAIQLRIGAPLPGESLSSCLDRASSLWHLPRQALVFDLTHLTRGEFGDPDVFQNVAGRESLAASMAVPSEVITRHAADSSRVGVLMSPSRRNAYCPLCFQDDFDAGLTPYFRLDWARFFLTHCPIHGSPLFDWEALSTVDDRRLPHTFFMGTTASQVEVPWFANALERATKYASGEWPEEPRSKALWLGLMQFEKSLMDEGLGNPKTIPDEQGLRRETMIYNLMSLLVCSDLSNMGMSAAVHIHLAFEDPEVIGFTTRRNHAWMTNTKHTKLQSSLRWLVCRRVLLILAAQTLEELDAPLWFSNGDIASKGSSDAWCHQLKSIIPVKVRAQRAARHIRQLHGLGSFAIPS